MASRVSSVGEAVADVTQQSSILEEQLKRDLGRLNANGFFAIQCVAVRNDVNQVIYNDTSIPLLVPDPPITLTAQDVASLGGNVAQAYELAKKRYIVRCDQLVFFTTGTEQSARWAGPGDLATFGGGQRSKATRVYYGHGVQFPQLSNNPIPTGATGDVPTANTKPIVTGARASGSASQAPIMPWSYYPPSARANVGWRYGNNTDQSSGAVQVSAVQPEARQWLLARRSVLLADDGGSPWFYPEMMASAQAVTVTPDPSSAPSIFGDKNQASPTAASQNFPFEMLNRDWVPVSSNLIPNQLIQSGWVDIASSDMDAVRRVIAPNLPLTGDYTVWQSGSDNWTIRSVAPPWAGYGADGPLGWPLVRGGVRPFPTNESEATIDSVAGSNMGSTSFTTTTVSAYSTQRDRIMRGCFGTSATGTLASGIGLLGWPRAERTVANVNRRTEMLTSPVLLANCSSFRVDWTWAPLVGRVLDGTGQVLAVTDHAVITNSTSGSGVDIRGKSVATMRGFEPWALSNRPVGPIPWFGYPDTGSGTGPTDVNPLTFQQGGVTLAQTLLDSVNSTAPNSMDPPTDMPNAHMGAVARAIEGYGADATGSQHPAVIAPFGSEVPVRVYTAVFGFNAADAYSAGTEDRFQAYLGAWDTNNDGKLTTSEAAGGRTPMSSTDFQRWDLNGNGILTRAEFDGANAVRVLRDDFTPWPSQLRITATIHDPRLTLDRGREVQFVIDVPNRGSK
jgi:hypothetical protein